MIIKKSYSYDDLFLVPKKSSINSRADVDLTVDLGKGVVLDCPVICANMKTIASPQMAGKLASLGALTILHRFTETRLADFDEAICEHFKLTKAPLSESINHIGVSVGLDDSELKFLYQYVNKDNGKIICVDVAHGHHDRCINQVEKIHKDFPNCLLIAGNVATAEGAKDLYNAGADVIKLGVGSGCFAAGTRVLMANGFYKNIEEIKKGDRVINKDGKPVNVIKSFCTGNKNVIKIRNSIYYEDTYVTPTIIIILVI